MRFRYLVNNVVQGIIGLLSLEGEGEHDGGSRRSKWNIVVRFFVVELSMSDVDFRVSEFSIE